MRILFLATNPAVEASTRYRVLQFFPALQAAGHNPELVTFFDDWSRRKSKLGKAKRLATGVWRRLKSLAMLSRYDLVVVHRELLPRSYNHPVALFAGQTPMVYDFDDAVWLAPAGTANRDPRHSARWVIDKATRVLAGNEYLADYARQSHNRVDVIPTVVDTDHYKPAQRPRREVPIIGWIGSPTTLPYLAPVFGVLQDLSRVHRFRFRVIGGKAPSIPGVEVDNPPWSMEEEAAQFQDLDIGLYPLADDVWARGKCGFKAIQYLASGVAAVVSPVGVVRDIVAPGRDGLWATARQEWLTALTKLLAEPEECARLAANGRKRIVEHYSLATWAPRLVSALERAAGGAPSSSSAPGPARRD